MSELITGEIFTDGQQNIAAANMNGIIGKASVQPDVILNKPASATMDIADQFLVLKTDNTLARTRFDTIVNSTSSSLPLADTTKNGMLRKVSGKTTDVVDGTNNCVSIHNFLPAGIVVDYAGPTIPPLGWLYCSGQSVLRTDYPDLFVAIGTAYGSVDSTHFTIPDYRGKLNPGVGGSFGALAATGGAASVALAIGHLPAHTHTLGNHTHVGADHTHSLQNHTHNVDHYHSIPGAQFSHTHGFLATVQSLGTGVPTTPIGTVTSPAAYRYDVSASGLPDGNTASAGSTSGAWANSGGPNIGNTSTSQQGLSTGGPSTNTSDPTGSGTAFSILPPFQTVYKIIKT